MRLISSSKPSSSNIGMFIGSSDSPIWKRGCLDFSSISTSRPRCASNAAMVEPAGPPPITSTSHVLSCSTMITPQFLQTCQALFGLVDLDPREQLLAARIESQHALAFVRILDDPAIRTKIVRNGSLAGAAL